MTNIIGRVILREEPHIFLTSSFTFFPPFYCLNLFDLFCLAIRPLRRKVKRQIIERSFVAGDINARIFVATASSLFCGVCLISPLNIDARKTIIVPKIVWPSSSSSSVGALKRSRYFWFHGLLRISYILPKQTPKSRRVRLNTSVNNYNLLLHSWSKILVYL